MTEYLTNELNAEHIERCGFEEHDDYYHDIDFMVQIYELLDGTGYQQFVWDENGQEKISFGIPLKTVDDLVRRYKSIAGHDLKYYTGDLPINAQ